MILKLGTATATAISVLLVTTACGGGDSTRPSVDEVSTALVKGAQGTVLGSDAKKVSKKGADCIAKVLVDSGISDRALLAIVNGNKAFVPTTRDTTEAVKVRPKIIACLPAGLPQ